MGEGSYRPHICRVAIDVTFVESVAATLIGWMCHFNGYHTSGATLVGTALVGTTLVEWM